MLHILYIHHSLIVVYYHFYTEMLIESSETIDWSGWSKLLLQPLSSEAITHTCEAYPGPTPIA